MASKKKTTFAKLNRSRSSASGGREADAQGRPEARGAPIAGRRAEADGAAPSRPTRASPAPGLPSSGDAPRPPWRRARSRLGPRARCPDAGAVRRTGAAGSVVSRLGTLGAPAATVADGTARGSITATTAF